MYESQIYATAGGERQLTFSLQKPVLLDCNRFRRQLSLGLSDEGRK